MFRNIKKERVILVLLVALQCLIGVSAAEEGINYYDPVFYIKIVAVLLIAVTAFVIFFKEIGMKYKTAFFYLMVIPVALASVYLAAHTVHHNLTSQTNGPVHWHADFQIYMCGERLDLVDPTFPSNKIGSPLFHEHNDDRLHVEGTVSNIPDVDLGAFFAVIGGTLEQDYFKYPSTNGEVELRSGDQCPNGQVATLNVYVNGALMPEGYADYLYYPHAYVPPGDCIIVDFSPERAPTTTKICESWDAKGWSYDSFQRPEVTIGGITWQ